MASALTKFGTFCREKRTLNNRTMGDQAEAMGVETTFISAIETGSKKPPLDYVENFGRWLKLDAMEMRELTRRTEAVVLSFPTPKHVSRFSTSMRLFRRISKMNPNQIRDFRKQGQGENKDDG